MKENFDKLCRICVDAEENHVAILEDHNIQLHLKVCLGLVVTASDKLPKTICVSCVSHLNDFYNLIHKARSSQDWLESFLEENKKAETKFQIQPLPDSEYNSDSLLEFLNNTANIDEYLTNLGKEDIPSIVNMLDKNSENSIDAINKLSSSLKSIKEPSPKKTDQSKTNNCEFNMEIDILDSDIEIVKEILMKETKTSEIKSRTQIRVHERLCHGCKTKFDSLHKLTQHITVCDLAVRTCSYCFSLFDSRKKMQEHAVSHHSSCNNKNNPPYENCSISSYPHCKFKCKKCGVVYRDRFLLFRHVKQHIIKDTERICDICGHRFYGEAQLSEHRKKIHSSLQNVSFRCKICGLTSEDRRVIYNHVKQHTLPQLREQHLCEKCAQSFTTRNSLERHLQAKHNILSHRKDKVNLQRTNEQNGFMCESCGDIVTDEKSQSHTCAVLGGGHYKFLVEMPDE